MNELVVSINEIEKLNNALKDSTDVINLSRTLVVKNQETYDAGYKLGKSIKLLIEDIKGDCEPICKLSNELHKKAVAMRDKHLKPVLGARDLVARKMNTWHAEQERKRQEAKRKEKERLEKDEENRRLKEAEKLEAQGLTEAAEEILEEPIITPPPSESFRVKRYEVEKPKGLSHASVWTYDMIDVSKLKREYMIPDEVKIGKLVRAAHKDAEKIVGEGAIRAWDKGSTRIR